ncbi:MAG: hypothetical protein AAF603_09820 [Pseudomonadota bacterium]
MKYTILASLLLLLLGACTHPSEKNRFAMDVTERVCNVDALATEKNTSLATINNSRRSIREYQNRRGNYSEETFSILTDKLNTYEAQLESSYRFVTQNCGAYMRCIERNNHKELQCTRSEQRWADSQKNFESLIVQIRQIDADVAKAALKAKHKKPKKKSHKSNCGSGKDCSDGCYGSSCQQPSSCCDVIGSIFTDCCDGN